MTGDAQLSGIKNCNNRERKKRSVLEPAVSLQILDANGLGHFQLRSNSMHWKGA